MAPTPQDGVKVSYPLAPRGPLSEREQEGELFQGDCSEFVPFSFLSASNPQAPCSSQRARSLAPQSRPLTILSRDASLGVWRLLL